MGMTERLYKIDQMLSERRFVTFDELLARLAISRATLKRDLAYMRDRLNAPIIFDRELRGYRFDKIGEKLNGMLGSGYGIFSGEKVRWATLLFTPKLARWVSVERWLPNQKGKFNKDGSYELKIHYSKDSELVMDILSCGTGVKVLHPEKLRLQVISEIDAMKLPLA